MESYTKLSIEELEAIAWLFNEKIENIPDGADFPYAHQKSYQLKKTYGISSFVTFQLQLQEMNLLSLEEFIEANTKYAMEEHQGRSIMYEYDKAQAATKWNAFFVNRLVKPIFGLILPIAFPLFRSRVGRRFATLKLYRILKRMKDIQPKVAVFDARPHLNGYYQAAFKTELFKKEETISSPETELV